MAGGDSTMEGAYGGMEGNISINQINSFEIFA